MNKTRKLRRLKKWLKNNRSRFAAVPYISRIKRKSFYLKIQGFNCLYISVRSCIDVMVFMDYQNSEVDDWLGFIDFPKTKKDEEGKYFCTFICCEDKNRYNSKEELLEAHTYLPFLELINSIVQSRNELKIMKDEDGDFLSYGLHPSSEPRDERFIYLSLKNSKK